MGAAQKTPLQIRKNDLYLWAQFHDKSGRIQHRTVRHFLSKHKNERMKKKKRKEEKPFASIAFQLSPLLSLSVFLPRLAPLQNLGWKGHMVSYQRAQGILIKHSADIVKTSFV